MKWSEAPLPVSNTYTSLILAFKPHFKTIQGSNISELVWEGTPASLKIHREPPRGCSAAGFQLPVWPLNDWGDNELQDTDKY